MYAVTEYLSRVSRGLRFIHVRNGLATINKSIGDVSRSRRAESPPAQSVDEYASLNRRRDGRRRASRRSDT